MTSTTLPTSMTAARVHETGDFDAISVESVAVPEPADDQVLVKLAASGVNFIDTYQRSGLYKLDTPFTLGKEGAGEVVAVGAKVTQHSVGDKVAFTGVQGCYAQYVVAPAAKAIKIPAEMDLKTAAAIMLQGLTAHYLATSTHPIQAGETVLIHAGAGGTGGLLIQMAKIRGATVITTVSTEAKAELARESGADHVILYSQVDFQEAVMKLTDNKGVSVVYDGVGLSTWEKSLASLAPLGHLILFGNASGAVPAIDPLRLCRAGSITLTRPALGHYIADPEVAAARVAEVFGWISSGQLKVHIGLELPLESVKQAQQSLVGRKTTGKILLLLTHA